MIKQDLFKTIVGSTAYGTNVQGSDIDYKGIYAQHPQDLCSFKYQPQIEHGKDETHYELRRFLELLQSANPTVLEMLYMPDDCIITRSHAYDILVDYRDMFLTKKCLNSFGGYAVQQIQKARGLNKKMNWENDKVTRKTPIDFCYMYHGGGSQPLKDWLHIRGFEQEYCGLVKIDHIRDGYVLYYDIEAAHDKSPSRYKGICGDESNTLRLDSILKGMPHEGYLHYNKDGYTQHCTAYKQYETWLAERNTQRYVDIQGHGQKIDGKNMLHCRRLLDMAIEIAVEGTINVRRPNAKELIAIRRGEVDLETILKQAEEDILKLNEVYAASSLPDEVDFEEVNDLLILVRENVYEFK